MGLMFFFFSIFWGFMEWVFGLSLLVYKYVVLTSKFPLSFFLGGGLKYYLSTFENMVHWQPID